MATVKTNADSFWKAWEGLKVLTERKSQRFASFANYTPYDGDESFLAPATNAFLKSKIIEDTKAKYEATVSQWTLVQHQSQIFLPAIFQKTMN